MTAYDGTIALNTGHLQGAGQTLNSFFQGYLQALDELRSQVAPMLESSEGASAMATYEKIEAAKRDINQIAESIKRLSIATTDAGEQQHSAELRRAARMSGIS